MGRSLHLWAVATVWLAAAPLEAAPAALEAVGAPHEPAYIYLDELVPGPEPRLRRPPGLMIARNRPLRVQSGIRYLWVIDARGAVRVAPEEIDPRGVERSGHPQLTGGRAARLGGVLIVQGGVAHLDSDSGRFAYMNLELTPAHLEAAARWIDRIGIVDEQGRRTRLRTRFVPPISESAVRHRLDARDLKLARNARRFGGYTLLTRPGASKVSPLGLETTIARMRWTRAARALWKGDPPRGRRAPTHLQRPTRSHRRIGRR